LKCSENGAAGRLQDLDRAQQDIQRRVQEGQLFAFQGEEQIRQLELQRLPVLRQIAAAMQAAAITDDQRQAVADFQAQIDALASSTNKAALESGAFKRDVEGALTSDLTNWFSSGISGAESLGDAFRGLAASVVQSLRQMAAQMLANLLIQKMAGHVHGRRCSWWGRICACFRCQRRPGARTWYGYQRQYTGQAFQLRICGAGRRS
jgi:hypothetical protein